MKVSDTHTAMPHIFQCVAEVAHLSSQLARRFGPVIDVRNRGALRFSPRSDRQGPSQDQPAVVRMWYGEQCRELSSHDARAMAAQLNEAAEYAERQNNCR